MDTLCLDLRMDLMGLVLDVSPIFLVDVEKGKVLTSILPVYRKFKLMGLDFGTLEITFLVSKSLIGSVVSFTRLRLM
jgi:hypothetical protein